MGKFISGSVVLCALLMGLGLVTAFASAPGNAAPMQTALDAYTQFVFNRSRTVVQPEFISHARKPAAFTPEMSAASYSSDANLFAVANVMRAARGRPNPGNQPIPYPAKEVWCARLNIDESASMPRYIFIARHANPSGESWIIHEPPVTKNVARQFVDEVQCAP